MTTGPGNYGLGLVVHIILESGYPEHPQETPTGTPTETPTETPTGIALSWMPTTDDPYCGFCVWLVQGEMDQVWLWLELGWLGFSCIQGKARFGLVVFGIRPGLV
jgi:hypothetical protein